MEEGSAQGAQGRKSENVDFKFKFTNQLPLRCPCPALAQDCVGQVDVPSGDSESPTAGKR